MEKLIELLNESTNGRFKSEQDLRLCIEMRGYCREFISWLVENDKIEFSKVKEKTGLERELYERMLYWYEETDFLIMLLSVENEPTSFLLSILK